MEPIIRVAVVDDDAVLLSQAAHWFAETGDSVVVASTAESVNELLAQPRLTHVVLLDLLLRDGREPAENVRRLVSAGFTVVAISSLDNPARIRAAISAGAHSYVRKAKDAAEACAAIRAAASGAQYTSRAHAAAMESAYGTGSAALSPQEREALRLYASGMTIPQLSQKMNIKVGTGKGYIDRARRKYESLGQPAHTKIDLRQRATEDGLLDSAEDHG
jgi:DNA-binding NarL/FixJ family response regulator